VETVTSPAFPVLDAVLKSPLPKPEKDADSVAVAITLPPCPAPLVLLTTCDPLARLKIFAFSKMLPALPAPDVATDIVPPSAMFNVGTGANPGAVTVICPAFPVLEVVLKSPLAKPDNEADSLAMTVMFPPWPELVVLLSTRAPPVCVKLLTLSEMLPAFPMPEVATEIVPLSPIVNVGVETVI
jgi:hypothetical protein